MTVYRVDVGGNFGRLADSSGSYYVPPKAILDNILKDALKQIEKEQAQETDEIQIVMSINSLKNYINALR